MVSLINWIWDGVKNTYKGSYLEYYLDTAWKFFTTLRFGRFPDWKHEGWQMIGYFGELPDPRYPAELMLGWRTVLI